MELLRLKKLKKILVRELDHAMLKYYHQSLAEIMNDLYVRGTISRRDLSADAIFCALRESRLLDLSSTRELVDLRETLDRLNRGNYGSCLGCGRSIPRHTLAKHPTIAQCKMCQERTNVLEYKDQSTPTSFDIRSVHPPASK